MAKSERLKKHIKRAKGKLFRKNLKYRIKKMLHIRDLPDTHKYDLNIVDLNYDDDEEERSGKSRITSSERRRLSIINHSEELKAQQVMLELKKLNNKTADLIDSIRYNKKSLVVLIVMIVSVLGILSIPIINNILYNNYKEQVFKENVNTVLSIDMNSDTKKLKYNIDNIAIESKDGYISVSDVTWLKTDIDTDSASYTIGSKEYTISKPVTIDKFSISNTKGHIVFSNNEQTASKEFIIGQFKDIDNLGNIPVKSLKVYESKNTISIRGYLQSRDDSILYLAETLGGGELTLPELKQTLKDIEDTINLSDMSLGVMLKLAGVGDISLSKLNANMVEYSRSEDVLIVKKSKSNEQILLVFDMENETIGCKASDFLETTQDGLFIHKNFNIEDNKHYGVFAILKDNKLYTFKALGTDMDNTFKNVCEQVGFNVENLEIKVVQPVVGGEQ